MTKYLFLFACLSFVGCKQTSQKNIENDIASEQEVNYQEQFRPQFHFTPPANWMNDPNGMVFYKGVYHLFYQYYPDDTVWGPMHWGHATSENLIHWEHKPVALFPDELGYIFSGSAVVDFENTSGFGTLENPPLVAIYTYHNMEGEQAKRKDFQTQAIAYSLDAGDTWTKFEGNPVIGNKDIKDFRDPKVMWHRESSQWIMTLVAGDHAKFYGSSNLKEWKLLSEFGKDKGAHGGVWECPDLFKIKVEGTQEEKWVLFVSINPGAPNGGSGTQYFIGDFDGTTFTTDQDNKWIDYGRDNYAGITYSNAPDNKRLFIGWMSNWDYARNTPTVRWRSAMTLPRSISLHADDSGYYLKNYPVESLSAISSEISSFPSIDVEGSYDIRNDNLNRIDVSFEAGLSEVVKMVLLNEKNERVVFEVNATKNELWMDRTNSGLTNFEPRFAGTVQTQPYVPTDTPVEFRCIVDASSIEVFIDKGRYVFTNQIFPKSPYTRLQIVGKEGTVLKNYSLKQLTSIWSNYE